MMNAFFSMLAFLAISCNGFVPGNNLNTVCDSSSFHLESSSSSTESESNTVDRRSVFGGLVTAGVATFGGSLFGLPEAANAKFKTGAASVFTGDYDDPNHPGCLRQVKVVGPPLKADGTRSQYPIMEVIGYDGAASGDICSPDKRPTRADLWKIQGVLKSDTSVSIDFSPKGGPANLVATWDGSGIVFPDGNKWTKVPLATNDRRPKDMSTLKSN